MKYEYRVTQPKLPPGATSPVMDYRQMEWWLNKEADNGWELVTYGQKLWKGEMPVTQDWWVFRRPVAKKRTRA